MRNGVNNDAIGIKASEGLKSFSAPLDFDPARYAGHVEEFDLTEAQTLELLTTLWSIMCSFVELGFSAEAISTVFPVLEPIPDGKEAG